MTNYNYEKEVDDKEQLEYIMEWELKRKLKRNKRKEKIKKIKEFIYKKDL